MSIEFRVSDDSPVEVSDTHQEISARGRKRFLVDGGRAFDVWRGKHRERLLAEYEQRLRTKPVATVSSEPLRQTIVPEEIVKQEPVEQVVVADVAPPIVVTAATDYELNPDDWFECVVQRVSRNGRALILQLENTTATCVPRKVTESPGDHGMACLVGMIGAVRLQIVGGVYRALELQILKEPSVLRETAKVAWRDPLRNIFKAVRPCGCEIFIAGILDEVIYGDIKVGDEVAFDLERSRSKGNWIGLRARRIDAPQMARSEEN